MAGAVRHIQQLSLEELFDAAEARPASLPPGYYLDNFETLLATVYERYRDLLVEEELAFFDDFAALREGARRLYVRLISRRGPCFRYDRLAYPEIPDLDASRDELKLRGFADDGGEEDLATVLGLLHRRELLQLVAELGRGAAASPAAPPPSKLRKAEIVDRLVEGLDAGELRRVVGERMELLRPLRLGQIAVFRLLFFGNLRQDLSEFVLRDLGLWHYESYELHSELRLFADRGSLDHTLELLEARRHLRRQLEAEDEAAAMAVAEGVLGRLDAWHPATRPLLDRILNRIGRHLERRGEPEQALVYYGAAWAPPSRERRARILARLGAEQLALELTEGILAEPLDETEADFAPRFAHRLRRRQGLRSEPPPRPPIPTCRLPVVRREGVAAEAVALEALGRAGCRGFFAENWLWRTLFGLAFWDVIFAPVRGAFQHPFQSGPLDLYTPAFRRAREPRIARRLAELEADPEPGRRIADVYREKYRRRNRLVAWSQELKPHLELALEILHGRHLSRIFDRLSRDLGRYRRGFPDLFVVRDVSPGFELLEVKAPGDQLRPEQRGWLGYLSQSGIPATVLQLDWA